MRSMHKYPSSLDDIIEKIKEGQDSINMNTGYYNKAGNFIWFLNAKGYYHILKPAWLKGFGNDEKIFALREFLLQDDRMIKDIDIHKFKTVEQAKDWLKHNYNFIFKK